MDKSKILKQLMATFLEELEEHVRSFNQDLLSLEKNPSQDERAERFTTLFRTAHSLKGAARSVNVSVIEGACHRLEEILSRVRDGRATLGPELIALLFSTVDAIEEAGMRLREQQDLSESPLAALLPRLDAAAGKVVDTPPIKASPPVELPPRQSKAEPLPDPSSGTGGSVRVPAEKLDLLLASVGELLVAQRRVESRMQNLTALQDLVAHWKTDWKRVEPLVARDDTPTRNGTPLFAERGTATSWQRALLVLRQNGDNLRRLDKSLEKLTMSMAADCRLLDQVTQPLNDEVHRVRMLPFSEACIGLDRMVRDLAQANNKEIVLRIEGGNVELDRSILEGLKDPLRHLIRNAVDHGIEPAGDRRQMGKPPQAQIMVSATLRGSQVEIHVEDDGRGLNLETIRQEVRRRKLDEPGDVYNLVRHIFLPGFSTAPIITDVSGRGVGLDVVKNRVESLHGTVDLVFTSGQGTRFSLTVPLTLTTLRVVLVNAGGQTYAFAGTNVQKLVHARAEDIRTVAGREVLSIDGVPLPIFSLAAVLYPGKIAPVVPQGNIPVLIVAAGTSRMALMVDELLAEQEILIKNPGTRIRRVPLLAGATLLPSGRIALVLNAANLIRTALQGPAIRSRHSETTTEKAPDAKKRLLVVEDSMTTRTLMKSILEAAGYEVATAVDGQAGWDYLQTHEVDLVVSDVDMPRMNGFELTETVRSANTFRDLPLILVTARASEADRARGITVGASAYLVKSGFDQRSLLETIQQLL